MVDPRQVSLVAFTEQRAGSNVLLSVRHALVDGQTGADFHLALVQRMLLSFIFASAILSRQRQSEIRSTHTKELGTYRYFYYFIASVGTVIVLLQGYNALVSGAFWLFYAAIVFQLAIGILQFAAAVSCVDGRGLIKRRR